MRTATARVEAVRTSLLTELARMSTLTTPSSEMPHPGGLLQEVLAEVDLEGTTYRLSRLRQRGDMVALTPRELEIARHVAQGLPTKAIGAILKISPWTVLTHLRRIYSRLSVNSRAAMVSRLSSEGLL